MHSLRLHQRNESSGCAAVATASKGRFCTATGLELRQRSPLLCGVWEHVSGNCLVEGIGRCAESGTYT